MSKKWLIVGGLVAVGGSIAALAVANRAAQRRAAYCKPMSTSAFRRQQLRDGVDLEGKDACHVIAKANGGPDHRDNFVACPTTMNRSLGHRGDDVMCEWAGPRRCQRARKAMRACGTTRRQT